MLRQLIIMGIVAGALPSFAQSGALAADIGAYEYKTYCAACHGAEGKGDGPVSTYITVPPPDLTVLARENGGTFPESLVKEIIDGRTDVKVHGPRDMPVWGDWFDIEARAPEMNADDRAMEVRARIENLTSYIKTLQVP
jgi:mono/diheme cytochrome c family protein